MKNDMHAPMKRLIVKNYGCIRNIDIALTPLHAFIGPNDSGKSTILQAAMTLGVAAGKSQEQFEWYGPQLWRRLLANVGSGETTIVSQLQDVFFGIDAPHFQEVGIFSGRGEIGIYDSARTKTLVTESSRVDFCHPHPLGLLSSLWSGAWIVRLDPDALRKPSSLIPSGQEIRLERDRGDGLAGVYDAIRDRSNKNFSEIERQVRKLFPRVEELQLHAETQSQKVLKVRLTDGREVKAEHISEGLLFYLAFAAIPYLERTSLLLVEEPENGLHPARIRDVVKVLREVSNTTQVLIATHNPLVVNELKPEEVSVVTREKEEGTVVVPIKDTPRFEERSKAYSLGELWLSYADGESEAPLLKGNPRP